MSLDSSMSLNIPSSLLVNAAPHSGREESHNTTHNMLRFNVSSVFLTFEKD